MDDDADCILYAASGFRVLGFDAHAEALLRAWLRLRSAPRRRPYSPSPAWRQTKRSIAKGKLDGGNDDDGLCRRKSVGNRQVDAHLVTFGRQPGQRPRRSSGKLQGGAPRRQIHHPHVAPKNAVAKAGAERLGAGFLGREAFGVGRGTLGAAVGFLPLGLGEDAIEESLAVARDGAFDAPDIDHVVAETDDHHELPTLASVSLCRRVSRAPSMSLRMRETLSAKPTKSASPTR